MSAEKLAAIAGIVLSLFFSYVPGFSNWFDPLDGNKKRLVMLALLLVVAGGAFGLSCTGLVDWLTCDQVGAWALVQVFIAAAIANQATFALSPKPAAAALRAGLVFPGRKYPTSPMQMLQRMATAFVGMAKAQNPDPTPEEAQALKDNIQEDLEDFAVSLLRKRLNDADRQRIANLIEKAWAEAYE